jgi:hypothetical protein
LHLSRENPVSKFAFKWVNLHRYVAASLANVEKLTKLRVLYMSNNKIDKMSELDKLGELGGLQELLLMGNPIFTDAEDPTAMVGPCTVQLLKGCTPLLKKGCTPLLNGCTPLLNGCTPLLNGCTPLLNGCTPLLNAFEP